MGRDATGGRTFERWLAVGVLALTALAVVAFLQRHEDPPAADGALDANVVRIEIGGRDGLRSDADATPPAPLPDPVPPRPDHVPDVAPPDDAPPAPTTRRVVVRNGDTLGHIAQRELGSTRYADAIQRLNGIDDPRRLRAGDEILVPVRSPTSD